MALENSDLGGVWSCNIGAADANGNGRVTRYAPDGAASFVVVLPGVSSPSPDPRPWILIRGPDRSDYYGLLSYM